MIELLSGLRYSHTTTERYDYSDFHDRRQDKAILEKLGYNMMEIQQLIIKYL